MRIEHIALWVDDLEVMKTFYEKYFGATAGDKYANPKKKFSSYFLSFENGSRLELMKQDNINPRAKKETMGLAHFAVSLGSKEKVDDLTLEMMNAGYEILGQPRTTGDGYYESVVKDPEGNQIELTI